MDVSCQVIACFCISIVTEKAGRRRDFGPKCVVSGQSEAERLRSGMGQAGGSRAASEGEASDWPDGMRWQKVSVMSPVP